MGREKTNRGGCRHLRTRGGKGKRETESFSVSSSCRGHRSLRQCNRLRPDQTPESATAALRAAQPQLREAALPKAVAAGAAANLYLRQPLSATPAATGQATGSSPLRDRFERPLWAILLLAILVVLIACANVANLVLARAVARRHELSVRRALGASGLRLACQVLAESLLLSVIGAALGMVIAGTFSEMLVGMVSSATSPIFLDLSLDWRVLGSLPRSRRVRHCFSAYSPLCSPLASSRRLHSGKAVAARPAGSGWE